MKAIEQYFPVVLFIMLYKVVLTFESVDEILMCDHSSESYSALLSCDAGCFCFLCNFIYLQVSAYPSRGLLTYILFTTYLF